MLISDDIDGEEEVDFVALVESPAIQRNFLAFAEGVAHYTADGILYTGPTHKDASGRLMTGAVHDEDSEYLYHIEELKDKFESYNDYPQSAKDAAARGIALNEKLGNRCATQVGKIRATQIMNGEKLSEETIKRTYSYLSRAAEYYNPEDTEACGTISYLLWGGESMLRWAESKMNQEEFSANLSFAVQDEEQKIVSGPLMIADLPIYRRDEEGEYYVMFTKDQIKKIVQRFFKKGYQAKVNIEHGKPAEGVYMFESYIIDRERGVNPPKGFEDVANGSWFGSFKIENEDLWKKVKDGTFKGFSVEGLFKYEKTGEVMTKEEEIMSQIFKILGQIEQN